jgi:hypothetical protein
MVIPIKGQYEQECKAAALSKMGVYTGDINNISDFITNGKSVKMNWIDPTDDICKIILSH